MTSARWHTSPCMHASALILPLAAPGLFQDEPTVRWYDLRGLMAGALTQDVALDVRPHGAGLGLWAFEPQSYDVPLEDSYDQALEDVEDLLEALLSERFELGAYDLDQRGGVLRVEGTQAVHADLQARLTELTALASERVAVEVWRVPTAVLPRDLAPTLDAATFAALVASSEATPVAQRSIPLGRRTTLATAAYEAAHYDYDVEVAQGAIVVDPQVTVVPTGTDLGVHVRLGADGRLLVRIWGRHGEPTRPFPRLAIPSLAGASVELPEVASQVVYGSAQLASGEALVLGAGAAAFLARVQRAPGASAQVGAGAPLQPMGELTSRFVRASPATLARAAPSGGWTPEDRDVPRWFEEAAPLFDPDEVLQALTALREARGLEGRIARCGDLVYAPDPGPLRAALQAELQALCAALAPETAAVEFRHGVLGPEELRKRSLDELVALLPERALGSVRVGETLTLVDVVESLQLLDFDVEIAQASAISDPIIGRISLGSTLWCAPLRAPDGSWSVSFELVHQTPGGADGELVRPHVVAHWDPSPVTESDRIPQPIGRFRAVDSLQLSATRIMDVRGTIAAQDGVWQLVHLGPEGGNSGRFFVVVARVSGRR